MTEINKYVNSCIYKIFCKDSNIKQMYIGSTSKFNKRKESHKASCKKNTIPLYKFIRDNGNWNNWNMEIIENCKCNNRTDLLKRERYYYDLLNHELNTISPYQSKQEQKEYAKNNNKKYREKNKEKLKEKKKEYCKKNKEKIKEYYEKYKEKNKEKYKEYYEKNKEKLKEKKKEYCKKNKEKIKERSKEYYEKNKEKIKIRKTAKLICECGLISSCNHMARHRRTKKHIKRMADI